MATRSSLPPDLTAHRRIPHPSPIRGGYVIKCTCGWSGRIEPDDERIRNPVTREAALNALFVEHVPEDKRRTYVLVDQRQVPDPADPDSMLPVGNFIMPEGVPCQFSAHWEDDGVRYVQLEAPIAGTMPVGEVRTADGKVFIL
jgi:hypothetical protein